MKYIEIKDFSKEFNTMLGERKLVFEGCNFRLEEGSDLWVY